MRQLGQATALTRSAKDSFIGRKLGARFPRAQIEKTIGHPLAGYLAVYLEEAWKRPGKSARDRVHGNWITTLLV